MRRGRLKVESRPMRSLGGGRVGRGGRCAEGMVACGLVCDGVWGNKAVKFYFERLHRG